MIIPGALPVAYSSNTGKELYLQGAGDSNSFQSQIDALRADLEKCTVWRGYWDPDATDYIAKHQVVDEGYLAIANKPTIDKPAPQPVGSSTFDLPDVPVWSADGTFTGVVSTGTRYTLLEPGWLQAAEVWVPEVTADTLHRILLINNTDPANPTAEVLDDPILTQGEWNTVAVRQVLALAGSVFILRLEALNSGSSTMVTGNWERAANANGVGTDPGLQNWGTRNNEASLRVNKTDYDLGVRTADLLSMVAGTVIRFVSSTDVTQYMDWTINASPVDEAPGDDTGHVSFANVTYNGSGSGGEPSVGTLCTMTATIPVASPTKYKQITGHWPTDPVPWADTVGLQSLDGVDQSVPDNAYGVRVQFQPGYVSPDWDLQATVGEVL